jgi:hypothetical protein
MEHYQVLHPVSSIGSTVKERTDKKAAENRAVSVEDKQARNIKFYMFKAEIVKRQLDKLTENQLYKFADAVCLEFLKNRKKDNIHEHFITLGNLQKQVICCQDEILQLAGIGKEWNQLSKIADEVRKISCWVEEIFCYAMVAYSEVERMHRSLEFMYQEQP